MTRVVCLRMSPRMIAAVNRRAADAGVDREEYILKLIARDLARQIPKPSRRFASPRLLGKFHSRGSTNDRVRAALAPKGHGKKP